MPYLETVIKASHVPLSAELISVGVLRFSEKSEDTAWLYHIKINDEWRDYYVAYVGQIDSEYMPVLLKTESPIPVRIDSGCMTGMTFGDKSCECKDQLDEAIKLIRNNQLGFVVHVPSQDGRGMGIDFKLQTLKNQMTMNQDTVTAARMLAGSHLIDRRTYHGAIACLKLLGLQTQFKLNIATNNPDKISSFVDSGFVNFDETRIHIAPTNLTRHHLSAKKKHLKHHL